MVMVSKSKALLSMSGKWPSRYTIW